MLTQCPQCETFFRLTAPQLRAARGMVRCGECDQLFNALDHLHEHIPPSYRVLMDQREDIERTEELFATDEDESATEADTIEVDTFKDAEDEPTESESAEPSVEELSLDDFIRDESQQMSLDVIAAADARSETDEEAATKSDAESDPMDILFEPPSSAQEIRSEKLNLEDLDDLPEALREDMQNEADSQRGVLSIVLWSIGIFLLLIGLAVQLGVSFQSEIEQRLPATRPLYQKLCVYLPCKTALLHEPVAIKLVARDVRHHPRFRNTLLVNGTLLNESEQTLAYPILQFELLDPTGTVIGVRQFKPAEYLDKSIAVDEGMPPGRPVHIVMEVLGASETAVSFEFSFL
jgi:predicted Zn finger-like uncharacterized protein